VIWDIYKISICVWQWIAILLHCLFMYWFIQIVLVTYGSSSTQMFRIGYTMFERGTFSTCILVANHSYLIRKGILKDFWLRVGEGDFKNLHLKNTHVLPTAEVRDHEWNFKLKFWIQIFNFNILNLTEYNWIESSNI